VNFLFSELGAKRLGLLHELLPKASAIGMLFNPTFADAETYVRDILIVAGIALIFIEVRYLYGVAFGSRP
jgi:ABC-type uncharacterized transport system substrate-binding protein